LSLGFPQLNATFELSNPMTVLDRITQLPVLPRRQREAHKGSFGCVLVIAGSRGMSGAAIMSGSGALRGGAGLVRVAVPHDIQPVVASGQPCYTTVDMPWLRAGKFADHDWAKIQHLIQPCDVLAIGPGLGHDLHVVRTIRTLMEKNTKPVILDADGLNAFAPLAAGQKISPNAPAIFTPHPGEFARMMGCTIAEVLAKRESLAVPFAAEQNAVLVLKGAGTLVTDGRRLYVNTTGNPGMATGGSGDVLTGLIAALKGQGLAPFEAAQLGVYLHGLAGDLARDARGEMGMIATDLLDYLPAAFKKIQAASG
jgi:NAD(P)H-hydrate epimerase